MVCWSSYHQVRGDGDNKAVRPFTALTGTLSTLRSLEHGLAILVRAR